MYLRTIKTMPLMSYKETTHTLPDFPTILNTFANLMNHASNYNG